ncbi:MAG TPA: hypothetical protein VHX86_14840 [Tepidisphaeraceae bacterium]|nr:hypothetical protein [Tepidisphaeraceae bacterium]
MAQIEIPRNVNLAALDEALMKKMQRIVFEFDRLEFKMAKSRIKRDRFHPVGED